MSWSVSLLLLLLATAFWLAGLGSSDDVFGLLAKIVGTVLGLVVVVFGHQLPLELLGLLLALSLPAARNFQHRSASPSSGVSKRSSRWSISLD